MVDFFDVLFLHTLLFLFSATICDLRNNDNTMRLPSVLGFIVRLVWDLTMTLKATLMLERPGASYPAVIDGVPDASGLVHEKGTTNVIPNGPCVMATSRTAEMDYTALSVILSVRNVDCERDVIRITGSDIGTGTICRFQCREWGVIVSTSEVKDCDLVVPVVRFSTTLPLFGCLVSKWCGYVGRFLGCP